MKPEFGTLARSLLDIQSTMSAELCPIPADLQLYCRFNQGIAGGDNTGLDVAVDDSGNGHVCTLTDFTLNGPTSNWVTGAPVGAKCDPMVVQMQQHATITWMLIVMTVHVLTLDALIQLLVTTTLLQDVMTVLAAQIQDVRMQQHVTMT